MPRISTPRRHITARPGTKTPPIRGIHARRLVLTALGLLACMVAAGCSSGHPATAGTHPASSQVSEAGGSVDTSTPDSSTTSSSSSSGLTYNQMYGSPALHGSATNSHGDKVDLAINLGTPTPVNQIPQAEAAVCDSAIAAAGSSPDRSIAVLVSATVITYGTLPTTVVLRLGDVKEETGQTGVEPPTDTLLWAKAYASGPVCGDSDDITAANIRWDNIAPGFIQDWHGWLILPNALSTDDPTGTNGTLSQLLLSPDLVINDEITYPTYTAGNSPNLVTCTDADGTNQWLAINPSKVKSLGCA